MRLQTTAKTQILKCTSFSLSGYSFCVQLTFITEEIEQQQFLELLLLSTKLWLRGTL